MISTDEINILTNITMQMSLITAIILVAILVFVITTTARSSIIIIQPHEVGILMVLGSYRKKLPPGINFVPPLVSAVHKVNLKAQLIPFEAENLVTIDRQKVHLTGSFVIKITHPKKSFFEVQNYKKASKRLAVQNLRSAVSEMEYTDIVHRSKRLREYLKTTLNEEVEEWGLKVKSFGIDDIQRIEY